MRSFFLGCLVALTAACGDSTAPDFSHAATVGSCGPTDAPITGILLSREPVFQPQPPEPHVRIQLPGSVTTLAGHTFDIGRSTDGPSAWYYSLGGNANAEPVLYGSVTITRADGVTGVAGTAELVFPTRIVKTEFDAPWLIHYPIRCG